MVRVKFNFFNFIFYSRGTMKQTVKHSPGTETEKFGNTNFMFPKSCNLFFEKHMKFH